MCSVCAACVVSGQGAEGTAPAESGETRALDIAGFVSDANTSGCRAGTVAYAESDEDCEAADRRAAAWSPAAETSGGKSMDVAADTATADTDVLGCDAGGSETRLDSVMSARSAGKGSAGTWWDTGGAGRGAGGAGCTTTSTGVLSDAAGFGD